MANLTEAQTEHWSQKETETHEIQLIHASTFGQQLICSEFQKRPFKIFIYYSTHFLRKLFSQGYEKRNHVTTGSNPIAPD